MFAKIIDRAVSMACYALLCIFGTVAFAFAGFLMAGPAGSLSGIVLFIALCPEYTSDGQEVPF